ncbi:Uncharacterised protein [Burkholderia pseudomallei]|nr:Uncharacterised protein [Burkholderia pseudomallei]
MPEASPESLGATSLIAASSTGLNATPAPTPTSIIPGSTCATKPPSAGARAKRARPAAAMTSPAPIARRMPKRITILADKPSENAAMIRFAGRNARPTWSGP